MEEGSGPLALPRREVSPMIDAVVIGSVLTVVIAVAIVGFLWVKVRKLMDQDAQQHRDR